MVLNEMNVKVLSHQCFPIPGIFNTHVGTKTKNGYIKDNLPCQGGIKMLGHIYLFLFNKFGDELHVSLNYHMCNFS